MVLKDSPTRKPIMQLKAESHLYLEIRQRLLSKMARRYDEEILADTLEGITNLHEMVAAVIRSALVDEALCTGLRLRLDEMNSAWPGLRREPPRSGSLRSTP